MPICKHVNKRFIALIPTKYFTGNKYEVVGISKLIILLE